MLKIVRIDSFVKKYTHYYRN